MGTRRLLKEGLLMKAKSGRRLYGVLCSDIMVLTDEHMKTLYRMVSLFVLPFCFFFLNCLLCCLACCERARTHPPLTPSQYPSPKPP